jgi:Zn-dependent peptidase ImmA (M78 family)
VSATRSNLTVRQIRHEATSKAEATLEEYWAEGTYPIDPVQIALRMGVEVFEAQLGNDVFGMLVGAEGGNGVRMFIDKDQPVKRYRFTCAHELGHYVDHLDDPVSAAYIDRRSEEGVGTREEIFANEFAGNLLMPTRELLRQIESGKQDFVVADHFGVSPSALGYRKRIVNGLGHSLEREEPRISA